MQDKIKYSDLGITGKNVYNIDAVMQGVKTILHTRVGERPFSRRFGSKLEDYLFEPFTFITSRLILSEILSSITRNDSRLRIVISSTDIKMNIEKRQYEVVIAMEIIGLEGVYQYSESLQSKA